MDFDFERISVPFRMRPDLLRMDPGVPHCHALAPASELFLEKRKVVAAGQAFHCVSGFDSGAALAALESHCREIGIALPATGPSARERAETLALAIEEDFAVLDLASASVPLLCVCVPSRWAPEEKLGLGLAAIHSPVADNAQLLAASDALLRLLGGGGHWERFVWTVTATPAYDQHPRRAQPSQWPLFQDATKFAAACYLRVERQTFLRVQS